MFDITHDLWEGIVKLEICLILDQFINKDKFFSLELLNNRIKLFNYGIIDKENKPTLIILSQGKLKIKETANEVSFSNVTFNYWRQNSLKQ